MFVVESEVNDKLDYKFIHETFSMLVHGVGRELAKHM